MPMLSASIFSFKTCPWECFWPSLFPFFNQIFRRKENHFFSIEGSTFKFLFSGLEHFLGVTNACAKLTASDNVNLKSTINLSFTIISKGMTLVIQMISVGQRYNDWLQKQYIVNNFTYYYRKQRLWRESWRHNFESQMISQTILGSVNLSTMIFIMIGDLLYGYQFYLGATIALPSSMIFHKI